MLALTAATTITGPPAGSSLTETLANWISDMPSTEVVDVILPAITKLAKRATDAEAALGKSKADLTQAQADLTTAQADLAKANDQVAALQKAQTDDFGAIETALSPEAIAPAALG